LKVGSVLEWSPLGGTIRARRGEHSPHRRRSNRRDNQFILSPGTLDPFAVVYYGAMRVKPEAVAQIQTRIFSQFPTVMVVNAADVLEIVQQVMDRVSLAVRFVAGFAIFGGLVVLASSIAGTRYPAYARGRYSQNGWGDARNTGSNVLRRVCRHRYRRRSHWRRALARFFRQF